MTTIKKLGLNIQWHLLKIREMVFFNTSVDRCLNEIAYVKSYWIQSKYIKLNVIK